MTAAPTGRLVALAIGGAAALLLLAVAGIRLDAQGVYYDEVHQAAGTVAYVGTAPEFFCAAAVAGVPVLTVPYQGALKTAVYGLWMRVTGAGFELVTWRWLGILLVAAGVVAFAVLAAPSLSPGCLAIFSLLVVSDVTVLLGSRHDYGPFAVGLLLRLLLLGAWLARPAGAPRSPANSFVLALLVGQLIYEKLHYVVLLLPLSLIVLGEPRAAAGRTAWRRSQGWRWARSRLRSSTSSRSQLGESWCRCTACASTPRPRSAACCATSSPRSPSAPATNSAASYWATSGRCGQRCSSCCRRPDCCPGRRCVPGRCGTRPPVAASPCSW